MSGSGHDMAIRTGGLGEALRVAMPLVIANSGNAFKLFTDRMMVAHYDGVATAAALTAGLFYFMMMSFWLGAAGYAGSFVAQYTGAGRNERVGAAIWQGVWLGIFGGLLVATGYFWAEPLFSWLNHDPAQQAQEVVYFQILCPGGIFFIINQGLSGFWSGRGKTWVITGFELLSATVNFIANYFLIFGDRALSWLGLPGVGLEPLGIAGSAWGTNISGGCALILTAVIILRRKNREVYHTWPQKKFDYSLFKRLLTFGLPSGMQFFLDIAAFNVFVQLQSGLGAVVGMASSIAFSVNALAFLPMIGFGMTASIFVGQAVGARQIPLAKKGVRSCLVLVLAYMVVMGVLYLFFPYQLCALFPLQNITEATRTEVYDAAALMMVYITIYLLFDGLFILYSLAIKGAGDTKFSMWAGILMAWLLYALPCYVALHWFHASVWTLWLIMDIYVVVAGLVFYFRYRRGKWQKMRVIED